MVMDKNPTDMPNTNCATIVLDIPLIRQKLYQELATRKRILDDFGVNDFPSDAAAFSAAVIQALGQMSADKPLEEAQSNRDVFRAAAKAIGSNSRNWCVFLNLEGELKKLLSGYDPLASRGSFRTVNGFSDRIQGCLPGQTRLHDTESIRRWADLLSDETNYYGHIQTVGKHLRDKYAVTRGTPLGDAELALSLVGHFVNEKCSHDLKFPGMGYALASEFMKNLGWNAFNSTRPK
jgi:hypothetical protein